MLEYYIFLEQGISVVLHTRRDGSPENEFELYSIDGDMTSSLGEEQD